MDKEFIEVKLTVTETNEEYTLSISKDLIDICKGSGGIISGETKILFPKNNIRSINDIPNIDFVHKNRGNKWD